MSTPLAGLIVVIDFDGVPLDEWCEWYDTEHVPERRAFPGFLSADWWLAADGSSRSVGTYDLESLEALETPEYLGVRADNASPWTKRIHRLRNAPERPSHRYQCVQRDPGGQRAPSAADAIWLWRADVAGPGEADGSGEGAVAGAFTAALAGLRERPGVLAARRYEAANHDARLHRHLVLVHLSAAALPGLAEDLGGRLGALPGATRAVHQVFRRPLTRATAR